MALDKGKIEERAVDIIEQLIHSHKTMESRIKTGDKELSWDGEIICYKPKAEIRSRETYDFSVPVQVKGHIDNEMNIIRKTTTREAVDVVDLENYDKEHGVLYFEIYFTEDGKNSALFYAPLYPTMVKYYLQKYHGRKRKKKAKNPTISVLFYKMNYDIASLERVLRQFNLESKKQGSGNNDIVKKALYEIDASKIKTISLNVIGNQSRLDILKGIKQGDICLYEKNDIADIPLMWSEDLQIDITHEKNTVISINDVEYYNGYSIRESTRDLNNSHLVLSDNLDLVFNDKNVKINIQFNSTIDSIAKDASFLLSLFKYKKIRFGNNSLIINDWQCPDQMMRDLQYITRLNQILNCIGVKINKPFKMFNQNDFVQFDKLLHAENTLIPDEFGGVIVEWNIDGKVMPFVLMKEENGQRIHSIYDGVISISVNNIMYVIPSFTAMDIDLFANLYVYDYEMIKQQIDRAQIRYETRNELNNAILYLIKAFDRNQDISLLELAKYAYDRYRVVENEPMILNKYQIEERLGPLDEEKIKEIRELIFTDDKNLMEFGRYVLLNDKKTAVTYFNKLDDNDRQLLERLPIMSLFNKLH